MIGLRGRQQKKDFAPSLCYKAAMAQQAKMEEAFGFQVPLFVGLFFFLANPSQRQKNPKPVCMILRNMLVKQVSRSCKQPF